MELMELSIVVHEVFKFIAMNMNYWLMTFSYSYSRVTDNYNNSVYYRTVTHLHTLSLAIIILKDIRQIRNVVSAT